MLLGGVDNMPARVLIRFNPSKPQAGEDVKVSVLARHPMEPGTRPDDNGDLIPADYLTTIEVLLNDELVASVMPKGGVSANPLFGFTLRAEEGEVKVRYKNLEGEEGETTETLELA